MSLYIGRKSTTKLRLASTLIALFAFVVQPLVSLNIPAAFAATPVTRTVCASGCTDTTVQAAIDASHTGDTVSIAAGTYPAPQFLVLAAQEGITIEGAGEGQTTLNLTANTDGFKIQANDVTIKDLTLTSSGKVANYGLRPQAVSNFTVENVAVTNMKKTGFDINGVTNSSFTNVTAENNGGAGFYILDSKDLTFTNTQTSGSGWGAGIGVAVQGDKNPCGTNNIAFNGTLNVSEPVAIYTEATAPALPDCTVTGLTFPTSAAAYKVTPSKTTYGEKYVNSLATASAIAGSSGSNAPVAVYTTDNSKYVVADNFKIQDAVNAADAGDTINVTAGTYNEDVNVDKSVTLEGAQAGFDARGRTSANVTVISNSQFKLSADNIVVDGFTLDADGSSNSAITGTGISGTQILNNVIENGVQGAVFDNSGPATALVKHNSFQNNSGNGLQIFGPGNSKNVSIVDNDFSGGHGAAINIVGDDVTISGNNSNDDYTFVVLTASKNVSITDNKVTHSRDGSGIFLGLGNDDVTVEGNELGSDATSANDTAAISLSTAFPAGSHPSTNYTITRNVMSGGWSHSIRESDNSYDGNLAAHKNQFVSAVTNNDPNTVIDATNNYWGGIKGPTDTTTGDNSQPETNPAATGTGSAAAIGAVKYEPYCLTSACDTFGPDTTAPVVDITYPSANQAVSGHSITIKGSATDADFNYYYCYVSLPGSSEVGTRDANCITTWARRNQRYAWYS